MIPIDSLPDDVLLEIFGFYSEVIHFAEPGNEPWFALIHVCRRWRTVVLQSPHRLGLRLYCSHKTPARSLLDVWPPLPLSISNRSGIFWEDITEGIENIVAALEHSDRVDNIELNHLTGSHLENILAPMQVPLPNLVFLRLHSTQPVPVVPESFLGGSAPNLQTLYFHGILFPALPKLLWSATLLVRLDLIYIPHAGYISPEVMVTTLSLLTSLESLSLGFLSFPDFPDQENQRPSALTPTVLPVLASLTFRGVSEYLEDLVARIDAPQLDWLYAIFFYDSVFDIPRFIEFISRTPTLKPPEKSHLSVGDNYARVGFSPQVGVDIICNELEWQVTSVEQVCTWCLPFLSTVEDLNVHEHSLLRLLGEVTVELVSWKDDVQITPWPELLRPFITVKNLYLSKGVAPHIASALQELVGDGMTEVLPTLQNIFLEGFQPSRPAPKGIQHFVAARQATTHPVAVSFWDIGEGYFSRFSHHPLSATYARGIGS